MEPNPSTPKSPYTRVLLIMVLGIIAYAGYSAYLNWRSQTDQDVPLPTAAPAPSPTPALPTPSPSNASNTAGWETYQDSLVTFLYPPQATLTAPPPGESAGVVVTLIGTTQRPQTELYDGISFRLVPVSLNGQSLPDFVTATVNQARANGVSQITQGPSAITIGSLQGYTFTDTGYGTMIFYYLEGSDETSAIHISLMVEDPTNQGFQALVDAMLGSLKLREPSAL